MDLLSRLEREILWKHPRQMSATAPNPAAQDVGRMPQTTLGIPAGGPFIRYTEESQQSGYVSSANLWGSTITLPIPAVSGFLRGFLIKVQAVGGAGSPAVVAAADAPWSAIATLTLRDPSGQPIYGTIDGYGLYLINLYSGQCGMGGQQNPSSVPSYSALQTTGGTGAGNFTFKLWVPLELNSSGYCALPSDNSAETPRLTIVLAASSAVYTTAPTTITTVNVTVEEPYWATPNNLPNLAPFDVGASAQWLLTVSGQNPPSNAAMRVLDQAVGQFVHTKIYVYRDSNNARQDFFPAADLTYWIDNFPYRYELNDDRYDEMYKFSGGITRPTGVIAFTWRKSVQWQISQADNAEMFLVTTGATKIELGGTWATNSNAPAQLSCYTGMVFPGPSGFPFGSQGY